MTRYYREQEGLRPRGDGSYDHVLRPAPFKSMGHKPVKGGRWSIRKQKDEGYWRAWTKGAAAKWSKRFYYWEDAFAWASFVARTYKNHPAAIAEAKVRLVWIRIRDYANTKSVLDRSIPEVLDELQHEAD